MFPIESFQNTLLKIVNILRQQGIPFHLTGGITGVAYGEPRLTQDIDIVLENRATLNRIETLIEALKESDFIFDANSIRQAVLNKQMFQLFDSVEALKLDMYPREMIEGELTRSQSIEVFESVLLPIASRMDAAISKLLWVQKGSHKSRRDCRQIARNSNEPELNSIRQMAKKLKLDSLFEEIMNESDEIID